MVKNVHGTFQSQGDIRPKPKDFHFTSKFSREKLEIFIWEMLKYEFWIYNIFKMETDNFRPLRFPIGCWRCYHKDSWIIFFFLRVANNNNTTCEFR